MDKGRRDLGMSGRGGAILVSPTAIGGTWSLMEGGIDGGNIGRILDHVRERWNVDERATLSPA